MSEIPSYSSALAFFHDQSHGENLLTDFNSYYASNSREISISYSSETVFTTFEPLIKILKSKFNSLESLKILEIGGSSGLLSKYLKDQGVSITMIETQPTFVEQATNRGIDARRYNGSNLSSVIHPSDRFNVIIANRVFEDIVMPEYSAKNLIRQSLLFLEPEGFFLIGSQNPSAIWNYGFLSNGLNLIDSQQSSFNPYIKEVRVYQK